MAAQEQSEQSKFVTITNLPSLLLKLFEKAHYPVLPESNGEVGLFIRYLRRKPQRGLAVVYTVDDIAGKRKPHANTTERTISLTVEEEALAGNQLQFSQEQSAEMALELDRPGLIDAPELGLSLQRFPADKHLPALAACCDTAFPSALFMGLQAVARKQLNDPEWQLSTLQATPIRYKPASRCVIRYRLQLQHTMRPEHTSLDLFGKLYEDLRLADNAFALQEQLYQEQQQAGELPLLPRPLAMLEALGLVINEAVEVQQHIAQEPQWNMLRTGTRVCQPTFVQGRGGVITKVVVPEEELRLAAQALARLHNSRLHPNPGTPRTGAKEARRAQERVRQIAEHAPALQERLAALAERLAEHLQNHTVEHYCAVHGGFKASQLLYHSHNVFVVDFDGFCTADPALDVGYFLAYLRPSGLWYKRQGMRQWFEKATRIFLDEYHKMMAGYGQEENLIHGIAERARDYEAALIFKIAARRANRLNSPRPQELAAMLDEISVCLSE